MHDVRQRPKKMGVGRTELFELLSNERRQQVIEYVENNAEEETVKLGDVAMEIAVKETGKTEEAVNSDERKRPYIALYQAHLPKMDEAGIVEYDQNRGKIYPGMNFRFASTYLGLSDEAVEEEHLAEIQAMKEILEEFEGIENIQEMQRLLESCEDSPMDDDYDTDEGYLSSAYNKIRNGFMD